MTDNKPREFHLAMIYPENGKAPFWNVYSGPVQQDSWVGEQIHVIEHKAYQTALEALRNYDKNIWPLTTSPKDFARETLEKLGEDV